VQQFQAALDAATAKAAEQSSELAQLRTALEARAAEVAAAAEKLVARNAALKKAEARAAALAAQQDRRVDEIASSDERLVQVKEHMSRQVAALSADLKERCVTAALRGTRRLKRWQRAGAEDVERAWPVRLSGGSSTVIQGRPNAPAPADHCRRLGVGVLCLEAKT
jgi:CRP-like cAMP-binding protein